jgi:hypothetical protein
MEADLNYFRVKSSGDDSDSRTTSTGIGEPNDDRTRGSGSVIMPYVSGSRNDREAREATKVLVSELRTKRLEYEASAMAASNVNPDADSEQSGVELWMKQLGLDKYIAGLRKDEMAASYKISKTESDTLLQDFYDVNK